ncbi:MAG: heme NO-binding domain-containing protein [Bacteroidetes bacterium]|nr:heme NO-binding domain-containing protein [Bacteroidota bacterium]
MKGIVFTEFLNLIEEKFGYELVDQILQESELPSKGVYTAIGTYAHEEMVELLHAVSRHTGVPESGLLKQFGLYFFSILESGYSHFLKGINSGFELLECIEHYIHVEVIKLYPDAELPRFESKRLGMGKLEMIYYSQRKMADFAEGLMQSAFDHYNEKVTITRENLEPDGSKVRFLLEKS